MNGAIPSDGFPIKARVQSGDFHFAAIQQHKGKITGLEQNIQKLENRLAAFKNKPYRDSKGFKRQGWKILIGTWQGEIRHLQEQIVWHEDQRSYNYHIFLSLQSEEDHD
jgi:hypothetical protein